MTIPSLNGNWVDLFLSIILLFYLWSGWGRGFLLGILDLAGFVLSFTGALKLYSFLANLLISNFSLTKGIANAAGFLLVGIGLELIYSQILIIIMKKVYPRITTLVGDKKKLNLINLLDKMLGFIPASGEAIIFTAFILTLLVTLPIRGAVKQDIISSKLGGPLVSHTQGIEGQLNQIFGEAVNETLTFLTINPSPTSEESIDLGFIQKEGKLDEYAEKTMLTLMNIERQKQNLPILVRSERLEFVARNHAKDMFERGYFSHYNPEGLSPFDRMDKEGVKYTSAGENLALAPSVVLAHQGLMNSPGHRKNILSTDFYQVGIGAVNGGIYGTLFVQEFTD